MKATGILLFLSCQVTWCKETCTCCSVLCCELFISLSHNSLMSKLVLIISLKIIIKIKIGNMLFCLVPNIDEDQSINVILWLKCRYEYGCGYRLKSEFLSVGERDIYFPMGYVTISGDVFGCHKSGCAIGI